MTKNVLFLSAFAAVFAIGCSGDDEKIESGDTGTTDTVGDDDDDTPPPPNKFDDTTLGMGVTCDGNSVSYAFDFLGEASEGIIDQADTANDPYWNDYHTLAASGFTDDGGYTLLDAGPIDVGVSPSDWGDGTGTVFRCDYHFDDPAVMTYAARAYDLNGALADCVAWGDDPAGMIAGDYFGNNAAIDAGDFGACRTAAAAR